MREGTVYFVGSDAKQEVKNKKVLKTSYYSTLTNEGYYLEIFPNSNYGGYNLGLGGHGYYHIWISTNAIESNEVYEFSGISEPDPAAIPEPVFGIPEPEK